MPWYKVLVVVFRCGEPDQVLEKVTAFIHMTDEDGVDCGYSSDEAGEMPAPVELGRHGGILDLPDDDTPHAPASDAMNTAVRLLATPRRPPAPSAALPGPTIP